MVAAVTDGPSQRANENWLRELRREGEAGNAAAELRSYLRRGMLKALGGRALREADLDDFTQEALVQILVKLDTFRGDSRFTTWAMAVAIRVAFSALRRRRYRDRVEAVETDVVEQAADRDSGPNHAAGAVDRRVLVDTLRDAIATELTDRQRTAVLGELEGVPSDELAERLGITRNALYKLHHDARRKLRGVLTEAGFSADDVREEIPEASK